MSYKKSNFSINLIELKFRSIYVIYSLLITFVVCFYFKIELFFFISNYFLDYENGFIYTGLLDPLIIYLKLSFLFAIILSFPVLIYIYTFFFLRSLYSYYLSYFFIFFNIIYFISFFLFLFVSMLILPILLKFLISFQQLDIYSLFGLSLQATITQYYSLFTSYLFIYILLVLIPTVYLGLIFFGILNKRSFINHKFRKYIYLIVILLFLAFAPPDFLLQLVIFPFILLVLEIYIYIITFLYTLYFLF